MTGFKEGSVDGWDEEEETTAKTEFDDANESPEQSGSDMPTSELSASIQTDDTTPRLPWIHRRNSITDGRDNTKQLHLQDSTVKIEREQQSEIESLLGESVKKADLREAALIIGLNHTEEITEQLQEWGYAIE